MYQNVPCVTPGAPTQAPVEASHETANWPLGTNSHFVPAGCVLRCTSFSTCALVGRSCDLPKKRFVFGLKRPHSDAEAAAFGAAWASAVLSSAYAESAGLATYGLPLDAEILFRYLKKSKFSSLPAVSRLATSLGSLTPGRSIWIVPSADVRTSGCFTPFGSMRRRMTSAACWRMLPVTFWPGRGWALSTTSSPPFRS